MLIFRLVFNVIFSFYLNISLFKELQNSLKKPWKFHVLYELKKPKKLN